MSTRLCKRCNLEKDVSEFPIDYRNVNWINNICKRCNGIRSNENNRKNKSWNKYNWQKRGLNLDSAYSLYNTQQCCQICGETTKLHLDHDHNTNKIRGMLCHKCNRALGFFKDNPKLLRKAADYLEIDKHGKIVYN